MAVVALLAQSCKHPWRRVEETRPLGPFAAEHAVLQLHLGNVSTRDHVAGDQDLPQVAPPSGSLCSKLSCAVAGFPRSPPWPGRWRLLQAPSGTRAANAPADRAVQADSQPIATAAGHRLACQALACLALQMLCHTEAKMYVHKLRVRQLLVQHKYVASLRQVDVEDGSCLRCQASTLVVQSPRVEPAPAKLGGKTATPRADLKAERPAGSQLMAVTSKMPYICNSCWSRNRSCRQRSSSGERCSGPGQVMEQPWGLTPLRASDEFQRRK